MQITSITFQILGKVILLLIIFSLIHLFLSLMANYLVKFLVAHSRIFPLSAFQRRVMTCFQIMLLIYFAGGAWFYTFRTMLILLVLFTFGIPLLPVILSFLSLKVWGKDRLSRRALYFQHLYMGTCLLVGVGTFYLAYIQLGNGYLPLNPVLKISAMLLLFCFISFKSLI